MREVERTQRLLRGQPLGLGLSLLFRARGEVGDRQLQREVPVDELDGLTVVNGEASAQSLMSLDERVEGEAQRVHIEGAGELEDPGDVVGGGAGLELVEEPEALLSEGERQRLGAVDREERRLEGSGAVLLQTLREERDGGGGEELTERQLDAEGGADAGDDLGGEEGVAAQLEEVAVEADALQAEDVGEDGGEKGLGGSGRLDEFVSGSRRGEVRSRQGLAVELAVGGEGEGRQRDESRGHHVLGQSLLEEGLERGGVDGLLFCGDEVGDETLVTGDVLTSEDDGVLDAGEEAQSGLDFTQLDAEAANLHLEVVAAEELEGAVREPASLVAGAVEASTGGAAEGVRNEALGGEVGAVEVTPCQAVATDEELSGDARRKRLEGGVEDEGGGVGERRADGDGAGDFVAVAEGVGGGEGGVLGGAVAVDEDVAFGEAREVLTDAVRRQHVTAGEQLADTRQSRRLVGNHLLEEGSGQPERGDLLAGEDGTQLLQREGVRRREDKLGAVKQGPPGFEGGGVEGDRSGVEPDFGGTEVDEGRRDEAGDAAVRDADTLGLAGGAGGEHDVGEVIARHFGSKRSRGPT
ncbi:hypothetical protein VZP55_35010 [Myxococcus faecalis]